MSADNGYVVTKLHRTNKFGVFYYSGDDDPAPEYYTANHACYKDNKRMVFDDPRDAIIEAHKLNNIDYTEYGVYVNSLVLKGI